MNIINGKRSVPSQSSQRADFPFIFRRHDCNFLCASKYTQICAKCCTASTVMLYGIINARKTCTQNMHLPADTYVQNVGKCMCVFKQKFQRKYMPLFQISTVVFLCFIHWPRWLWYCLINCFTLIMVIKRNHKQWRNEYFNLQCSVAVSCGADIINFSYGEASHWANKGLVAFLC